MAACFGVGGCAYILAFNFETRLNQGSLDQKRER